LLPTGWKTPELGLEGAPQAELCLQPSTVSGGQGGGTDGRNMYHAPTSKIEIVPLRGGAAIL